MITHFESFEHLYYTLIESKPLSDRYIYNQKTKRLESRITSSVCIVFCDRKTINVYNNSVVTVAEIPYVVKLETKTNYTGMCKSVYVELFPL